MSCHRVRQEKAIMSELGVRIGGSPFVNGPQPGGFGIRMYYNEESKRTRGVIVFDATKMGPPGCAHGGAIATILDEAMGAAAWFNGHPVLAVNLNVDLKYSVPLETEIEVTGWIERIDGRKAYLAAEMYLPDGRVAARSTGLFLKVNAFEGMTEADNPFRPMPPVSE
jgi:acyl-coenzyme A thioesterase PaaI-like protein